MSTRKHSPRSRAFRPGAVTLERRELLSGVVSGTDIDGDLWSLRLIGTGSISVLKQVDTNGDPSPLDSQTEISTITIGGTDPINSRVVGTVQKGTSGDGKVFFQEMIGLEAQSQQFSGVGLGTVSIDMPDFWLGNTTPSTATGTPGPIRIALPDGTASLRFGGVDRLHNLPAATSTTQSNDAVIALGLPIFGGSRIIIDKAISTSQEVPATTPGGQTTTAQLGVNFVVSGRLQLFQANEIQGDATTPPGQYGTLNTNATGAGGTNVIATIAGSQPYFPSDITGFKGGAGGQIGFVRVGGNATNFMTVVEDPTGLSSDKISDFYVGGETNNVMLIAPGGSRNVTFGKGMDNVEIRSHVINTLKANRGAVNSNVVVTRQLSKADFGGDVTDTRVLSGYVQNFNTIVNTVTGQSNSIFGGGTPAPPALPDNAQPFGGMIVHVAGDITNSAFAASVEPFQGQFGGSNQLVLPSGEINAKVEGRINNAVSSPDSPDTAFFAEHAKVIQGPVAPPKVPEAPFAVRTPTSVPGIHDLSRRENGPRGHNP